MVTPALIGDNINQIDFRARKSCAQAFTESVDGTYNRVMQ
jgi:hypothetical protein